MGVCMYYVCNSHTTHYFDQCSLLCPAGEGGGGGGRGGTMLLLWGERIAFSNDMHIRYACTINVCFCSMFMLHMG